MKQINEFICDVVEGTTIDSIAGFAVTAFAGATAWCAMKAGCEAIDAPAWANYAASFVAAVGTTGIIGQKVCQKVNRSIGIFTTPERMKSFDRWCLRSVGAEQAQYATYASALVLPLTI